MSIVTLSPNQVTGALVVDDGEVTHAYNAFVDAAVRKLGITKPGNLLVSYYEEDPETGERKYLIYDGKVGGDFVNPTSFGGGVPAPVSLSAQGQNEAPRTDPGSTPPSRE